MCIAWAWRRHGGSEGLFWLALSVGTATLSAQTAQERADYRLSPEDRIKVRVFQEDDLTGDYRVARDGTILFPLTGSVSVGGRTADQAAKALTEALRTYLKNPQVNISVEEFARRRFAILGEVLRPGSYPLPVNERMDLFDAIAAAGGFTRSANVSNIVVKRVIGGKEMTERISMKEGQAGDQPGFEVLEGDQILVGERLF